MDFELETIRPSSRRSRPLAWFAATSGVALVLLALASPHLPRTSATIDVAARTTLASPDTDAITTASIAAPFTPVRTAELGADHRQMTSIPASERHIVILLIFACFSVMAAGGLALWRRNWQEVVHRQSPPDLS